MNVDPVLFERLVKAMESIASNISWISITLILILIFKSTGSHVEVQGLTSEDVEKLLKAVKPLEHAVYDSKGVKIDTRRY